MYVKQNKSNDIMHLILFVSFVNDNGPYIIDLNVYSMILTLGYENNLKFFECGHYLTVGTYSAIYNITHNNIFRNV